MSKKFEAAFKGQFTYLAGHILVDNGLLLRLQDGGFITGDQRRSISHQCSPTGNAQPLLDILEKCPDDKFEEFCDILSELGQRDVVRALRERVPQQNPTATQAPADNMKKTFREAFQINYDTLVNKIDFSDTLLPKLVQKGVIMLNHVEEINAERTSVKQAEKLLAILQRRDDKLLPKFRDALVETHQEYLADLL